MYTCNYFYKQYQFTVMIAIMKLIHPSLMKTFANIAIFKILEWSTVCPRTPYSQEFLLVSCCSQVLKASV